MTASVCDYPNESAVLIRAPRQQVPFVLDHTTIDPRADESWDASIAKHPDATIFHTGAWANVLCDTYQQTPHYFRFHVNGEAKVLLPLMEVASPFTGRRGVCLPFSDFCGPLFFDSFSPGVAMVNALSDLARKRNWKYFELRHTPTASSALVPNKSFYAHELDLQRSAPELLGNFDSAARRAIRKAERSGLTTEISHERKATERIFPVTRADSTAARHSAATPRIFRQHPKAHH